MCGRVWSLEADRFSSENDADEALVQAITALAGFTLSLCMQNQENQKQAVCVRSVRGPDQSPYAHPEASAVTMPNRRCAASCSGCRLSSIYGNPSVRLKAVGSETETDLTSDGTADTDMIRICCQAFANLITANPDLADVFFAERLRLEETDKLLQ